MQKKYRALRTVARIFKVLAWIVLVLGIVVALVYFVGAAWLGFGGMGMMRNLGGAYYRYMPRMGGSAIFIGLVGAAGILLLTLLKFLLLLAASDLFFVLIDIEENTRAIAYSAGPKL
jgi:hypothetical protein